MPKKEVPVDYLQQYLPDGTGAAVLSYLYQFRVHLTIARERQSVLGDYRHRTHTDNHRISVNGNLNKYAFLVTLLHEIAHLLTFEQYGNRVQAHGAEWKRSFGSLLKNFLEQKVFPPDIEYELLQSLHNPAASSCAEEGLMRALRNYDRRNEKIRLVEELPEGTLFRIRDGRLFRKGPRLRKRFRCEEEGTKRIYLFSPVYEVELAE